MKRLFLRRWVLVPALAVLCYHGLPARAQQAPGRAADTVEVKGKRIVIEIDGDGRVIVDGTAVERPRAFRFEEGDDDVTVLFSDREGPRAHRFRIDPATPPSGAFDLEAFPAHFDRVFRAPVLDRFFRDGPEENAEVVRMEREAHELARRARRAEGAERTRLERELREHLATLLDRRLEAREQHIRRLEEELREERSRLQERRDARGEIVQRRLDELLGKEDVLDW